MKKGFKISSIISDQTMNFINGSTLLNIIRNFIENSVINKIPFYIITAYEDDTTLQALKICCPDGIYSKPLKKIVAENIIKKVK